MEEMENERRAKEAEEKAKKERLDKIHDQFENPNNQWESDKNNMNDLAKDEYVKNQDIKEASGEESDSTPVKKAEKQPEKHSEELPDKDSEDKAYVHVSHLQFTKTNMMQKSRKDQGGQSKNRRPS
jgi:mannan polymerase II complex ANP1 subunit